MDDFIKVLAKDPDIKQKVLEMYELLGRKQGFELAKSMNMKDSDPDMVRYFLKGFSDAINESVTIEHEMK